MTPQTPEELDKLATHVLSGGWLNQLAPDLFPDPRSVTSKPLIAHCGHEIADHGEIIMVQTRNTRIMGVCPYCADHVYGESMRIKGRAKR